MGKTTDYFRYKWNNYKMEARKLGKVMWKMLNKSFYKPTFCKMIIKVFQKMLRLDPIDKTQDSDPTQQEYFWTGTVKTLFITRWFKH